MDRTATVRDVLFVGMLACANAADFWPAALGFWLMAVACMFAPRDKQADQRGRAG